MVMEGLVRSAPARELAVGLRTYLEIVSVDAPSEAAYGDSVLINIYVRNKWTDRIFAIVTGGYDEAEFYSDSHYILPDSQRIFGFSFTMPNKSVDLWIWAWYWTETGWPENPDDEYGPISISLAPPVVGWQPLGTPVTLGVASVAPPVVGWQPLGTPVTLGVASAAPPVVGWQPLGTPVIISITAGPPVAIWELIDETIYPWAYFYDGLAAVWEFEFTMSPEEFPWTKPIAKRVVDELASRLEAEGSKLLELRIYLDRAGPLWSRWRGEVTVADLEQGEVGSIALAPALVAAMPWIIKGAVIAAVALVIYFTFIRPLTEKKVVRYEISEKIKLEWQLEDPELIPRMITALRPEEYPPEALEGKSDEELRDILNDVYKEEAEEEVEGWPWYIWATIAGLGIAGSLVAVTAMRTLAPKK